VETKLREKTPGYERETVDSSLIRRKERAKYTVRKTGRNAVVKPLIFGETKSETLLPAPQGHQKTRSARIETNKVQLTVSTQAAEAETEP